MNKTVYTLVQSSEHHFPNHPERPQRLEHLNLSAFPNLIKLTAQPASTEDVCRVHPPSLLEQLRSWSADGPNLIDPAPTYVTSSSYNDALLAAGGVLACTRAVLNGEAKNGFAIVRPPGHHAEPNRAMGFCLLSNAAIAAKMALAEGLERVAVIDFDVHHGNGTQACLIDEPRAGFFSSHQEGIYPGGGGLRETTHTNGRIVNVPLPAGAGVAGFSLIAEQLMKPFVRKFNPQLLIISAGYDAHWKDPLAGLALTADGYYQHSQTLIALADEFCGGKIVFVLEGGYDSINVANGITAGLAALSKLNKPNLDDVSPYDEPDISERIAEIKLINQL